MNDGASDPSKDNAPGGQGGAIFTALRAPAVAACVTWRFSP
jgi:hypothetical protein